MTTKEEAWGRYFTGKNFIDQGAREDFDAGWDGAMKEVDGAMLFVLNRDEYRKKAMTDVFHFSTEVMEHLKELSK